MDQPKKILIVEDDTALSELYRIVLSQAGFIILLGHDGEEGLSLASQSPDLILLDIMMPKMNGVDVLKHLKASETTKHIPVIMLSNLAQDTIISEALQQGAIGYIVKVDMLPKDLVSNLTAFFQQSTPST